MLVTLVTETLWLFEILIEHNWLLNTLWACISLASVVLFLYHKLYFDDLEYFIENVDVLGDFSHRIYRFYTLVISVIPIFAIIVILWSVAEGLNSRKFLIRFGCF